MRPQIRSAALAALAAGVGAAAALAQYSFTSVAEYPPRPQQFLQNPAINDHGQIEFMATSDTSPFGVAGLYITRSGPADPGHPRPPITLVAGEFVDARSRSIDGAGRSAYIDDGVFITDGHHTRQIADGPDDEETHYHSPALNDRGSVAFAADLDEDGNTAIFFCPRGGDAVAISDSSAGPLNFHSAPALDDSDRVVFSAHDAASTNAVVYVYSRGAISTLYENGVAPCVSKNGTIAFTRLGPGLGPTSILRGDVRAASGKARPLTPIADSRGPFMRVLADAVNDRGQVAFRGALPTGGIAVCIGDGRTIATVIQTGDTVLAHKVANLSPAGINNDGQIAVEAVFTDGSSAVIRAEHK